MPPRHLPRRDCKLFTDAINVFKQALASSDNAGTITLHARTLPIILALLLQLYFNRYTFFSQIMSLRTVTRLASGVPLHIRTPLIHSSKLSAACVARLLADWHIFDKKWNCCLL
jgi:hypothetical protein